MLDFSITINDLDKETRLLDTVAFHNERMKLLDPEHIDVTVEQFVTDLILRNIEGMHGKVVEEKSVEVMQRQKIDAGRARMGLPRIP